MIRKGKIIKFTTEEAQQMGLTPTQEHIDTVDKIIAKLKELKEQGFKIDWETVDAVNWDNYHICLDTEDYDRIEANISIEEVEDYEERD